MPLIYAFGFRVSPQKDEFKDKFKYTEQDSNGVNVEVSQLQHDLDTKPTNPDSHHKTIYASLLHKNQENIQKPCISKE